METRFFAEGDTPIHTTPEWYATIERAPHLDQPEHRPRLLRAAEFTRDAISRGCDTVSDLGAGDGGLLYLIRDEPVSAWGYDLIPANIEGARERGVEVYLMDGFGDGALIGECVVATETLEHLIDPHGTLRRLPDRARFIVASSPNGETWAQRYEFHTWGWDMPGYAALFTGAGWKVVRHEAIPGFQVLLASR